MKHQKTIIIIGAGPAGLTAALEILEKTDMIPIILEASDKIGGISRTEVYKGNRIDIGGHRFFSKSDRVMSWWKNILPIENRKKSSNPKAMLIRTRLSRIYFLRKFFDYPITLSKKTIFNLGFWRILKMGISYFWIRIFPIRKEKTLEDFFQNRFGGELYRTFFRDYTEKVWGVPCSKIPAEWGAQRIKGISVSKVLAHALRKMIRGEEKSLSQKNTETSLIGKFLYPKYGPGQMWETVAEKIEEKGGKILKNQKVCEIQSDKKTKKITSIKTESGEIFEGEHFLSTMPIRDLISGWRGEIPAHLRKIGESLRYRDFLTVGILAKNLKIKKLRDNWIYIQEPDVKVGRLQIFNNWSPFLVKNPKTKWIGLEYFCNEGDEIWEKTDKEMKDFAAEELEKIGILQKKSVLDGVVIRTPKAYPAYFGGYEKINALTDFLDEFENLFLIGRNGMHRYNNQDHSMLSAMIAVKNIIRGRTDKKNLWKINADAEYHESKRVKSDQEKRK